MSKKFGGQVSLDDQAKLHKDVLAKFKSKGPATFYETLEILTTINSETGSGSGEPKVQPPSEFLDREINEFETMAMVPWEKLPKWVQSEVDCTKGTNRGETFKRMLENLRKDPSEENLRLSLMLINEIGRFEDGGEYLSEMISQKLVNEFIVKEGKK